MLFLFLACAYVISVHWLRTLFALQNTLLCYCVCMNNTHQKESYAINFYFRFFVRFASVSLFSVFLSCFLVCLLWHNISVVRLCVYYMSIYQITFISCSIAKFAFDAKQVGTRRLRKLASLFNINGAEMNNRILYTFEFLPHQ